MKIQENFSKIPKNQKIPKKCVPKISDKFLKF